ncbi:hypothetical protein ACIBKY_28970 [Nonomuraea sp. NPDC050394]|uniref:hypothetical protein n=1 Tax=Nonomuraea sp. NPDC050394 TaxID=3364363 RepID=UPI0037AAEDD6
MNTDGQRLFLHVWENAAMDSQIHDHRWGFTSMLLAGRLVNTTYDLDVSEDSDMGGALIAAYSSDGTTFALDPTSGRTVVAVERARSIMLRGARYSQEPMELHRVAGAAGTVTLVARGRHVRHIARVLLPRGQGPSRQEFTPVTSAERDALIRSVLQQIA